MISKGILRYPKSPNGVWSIVSILDASFIFEFNVMITFLHVNFAENLDIF